MREPWKRSPGWRFGALIGGKSAGTHGSALGWGALELAPPTPITEGQISLGPFDPKTVADALIRQIHDLVTQGRPPPDIIDLYVYDNDAAFEGSRAQIDGLSRGEHHVRQSLLAKELKGRGWKVDLKPVKQ